MARATCPRGEAGSALAFKRNKRSWQAGTACSSLATWRSAFTWPTRPPLGQVAVVCL